MFEDIQINLQMTTLEEAFINFTELQEKDRNKVSLYRSVSAYSNNMVQLIEDKATKVPKSFYNPKNISTFNQIKAI
jgi:hypothetical protein